MLMAEKIFKKQKGCYKMKDIKIFAKTIDEKAKSQIDTLLEQSVFSNCKVRIMPDVHSGAGCVIGFTADLGDKVIPNIVGVDIGCGMLTVELGKVDIDFEKLDKLIKERIPYGLNVNEKVVHSPIDIEKLLCWKFLKNEDNWLKRSLCSLGGGNHFIEIDADESNNKYLIVHTGSRNLGKQVCEYYQQIAISRVIGKDRLDKMCKELVANYKSQGKEREISKAIKLLRACYLENSNIPKELCYLDGDLREEYLYDMRICQAFADWNRTYIVRCICNNMGWDEDNNFSTIHNYIDYDDNIVRKGAISAKKGEKLLIPINMRDGCIIGVGKGNKDWNCSAPHGAGRIMSRMQAKAEIKLDDYKQIMSGIYTTSVCAETIDEAPQAYKPMQEIIDCIADTVEIQKIIKPIYNFKATE